jgi:hypothetical protein
MYKGYKLSFRGIKWPGSVYDCPSPYKVDGKKMVEGLRNEETRWPVLITKYYSGKLSRRMRWAGHVARMGRGEMHIGFRWGDLREGDHMGDPGVDGRVILKWILKTWDGGMDWI